MKVYLATGNKTKAAEIINVLAEAGITAEVVPLKKLEVQSDSLEEIARVAAERLPPLDAPIVVEDAGLFVTALNGFPGPYSHYVFRTLGCRGLLKLLEGVEERRACFKSVVAVKMPSGEVEVFTGETWGVITHEERGGKGFGFDPIFQPEGSTKTFAEMDLEEKNLWSHRGRAVRKLALWLLEKYSVKTGV
uniref:dITP/XTP pyrophosphatase n=1 Tax=Thermofilum pendens TaxID=2269 RepID=A0A7C1P367_THEPE